MPMRLSGLMSGMDTESIVSQLVEARKEKVTKAVKAQKSLKYKQDAWKDLNKKILNLYNKSLNNMRFESSFIKKTTKVSNSSVVSVITGENAMNSVQNLKVDKLAKTSILTGGEIKLADWAEGEVTGNTKLGDLGLIDGESANMNITFGDGRDVERISVTANTTINGFVASLREAGLTVNFDENNGRIFMASKQSGAKQDFDIVATNVAGMEALSALKLNYKQTETFSDVQMNISTEARVKSLLDNYNNARAQQKNLADTLSKYGDKIDEILEAKGSGFKTADLFNGTNTITDKQLKDVDFAINALVKEAKESGKNPNLVKDLEGWAGSWKKTVATVDNVIGKYGAYIVPGSDGQAAWSDAQAIKDKVKADLLREAADYNNLVGKSSGSSVEDVMQDMLQEYADQRAEALASMQTLKETLTKASDWSQISAGLSADTKVALESSGTQTLTMDQVAEVGNAMLAARGQSAEAEVDAWIQGWVDSDDAFAEAEQYIAVDTSGRAAWKDASVEQDMKTKAEEEMKKLPSPNEVPTKQNGEDSQITLNGVAYYSSRNTFEINGLTLTVNALTGENEEVTITTEDDVSGIYDMVKTFIKEYSTLINEMDKLYNADSAKGYDPLTDEEKEAMSDSAIEEWEKKITDSILRKDSTLGTFSSEMKRIMMEGVEVNGKKMYLSNFGINTLSYFSAADNEKNAYHIDGDPDDEATSGNADVLKSMIANDPDTVVSFFTQLSKNLYNKMFDMMKGIEGVSSSMTAYEDKRMQSEYDDYTAKIKDLEKKLADYEDKWYAKFAAMETAMAKMQNNASAVTSLLGG